MNRIRRMGLFLALAVFVCACAPTVTVTTTGGPTISEAQSVSPHEKMRIAVARFENKTPYMVSWGMTDMLTSALFQTNRFIVLERENLDVVLQEQKLSSVGVVNEDTAIPTGALEGAAFLIIGAVTAFEPDYRGVKTMAGGVKQSYVAMDMRIVDSKTARVVASVTVEGQASDTALSAGLLKWIGVGPLVSSLKAWSNTPIDKAIRLCLDKAVDYIVTYSLKQGGKS